jgi:DNA-binding IclR family transcriptional regulator
VESTVRGAGTIDKAMALVALVTEQPRTLADLVEGAGLPRATTHRLATALEAHGLLRRDGDGRFALGLRWITTGERAAAAFPLADVARPHLESLRDVTGESAQLYVREGTQRRCVVAVDSPHELRTIVSAGALLTLERGSAARVLSGMTGRAGWVETVGDRQEGVASVSAPVAGPDGAVLAALSVTGPIDRIGRAPGKRHGDSVVECAQRISRDLA